MSTLSDPTPEAPDDRDDSRSDTTDARRPSIPHLVVGLVFLGVAGLWALAASGAVSSDDSWLLPAVLVVAGATGLVAALVGNRGTR